MDMLSKRKLKAFILRCRSLTIIAIIRHLGQFANSGVIMLSHHTPCDAIYVTILPCFVETSRVMLVTEKEA